MQQLVLAMLMSLPPAYADRQEEGRQERMETIADAITQATEVATCSGRLEGSEKCNVMFEGEPRQLATLLVTKGWWESRYAKNVHEGNCARYECDATIVNGVVVHKARSPWQFQKTSFSYDLWGKSVGTDLRATRNAALIAARVLSSGMNKCQHAQGALAYYANSRCRWSKAGNRYRTFRKLMTVRIEDPNRQSL
jgi:hypothetical protein